MKKVLFITPSSQEQEMVEEVARNHEQGLDFEFQSTASFGQTAGWWSQLRIDLLIISLPEDALLQAAFFSKLRKDVPHSLPLILISPDISQTVLQLTSIFSKVRILKPPLDGFMLYRSILDITTTWEAGKQQIHPRYLTEQPILISLKNGGAPVAGYMKNMSVGGAFFESEDKTLQLKPTDEIKIEIRLMAAEPVKFEFNARIVWVKDIDQKKSGYGCTFLDVDEVYERLMKGF
ncbi:MAG: PilZ domain-containing protein [Bdellovibrio sp.]